MSLSSTSGRNDYIGNGAVHIYPYSFRILLETHLLVTVRDTLGNETPLALTTDYTVDGVLSATGGNVTLVNNSQAWLTSGELTTGFALTIRRILPLTQLSDFRNQGDFFPETHEDEFDRGVMVAQQQQDELGRSLKLPETEAGSAAAVTLPLAADRAGNFLAFDGSGNPVASSGVTGVSVSSFMETVVDDASGSAALTTLRNDLLAETSPAVDDEVFLRDTSALTVDRMTLGNLFKAIDVLTAETSPAVGDEVPLYDVSAGTADKIVLSDLLKVVNGLTEDTTPDVNADFLLSYDTSAGLAKKVKPASINATAPTRQTFLSGSGTYTTPANARQLRIRMVGAGGGGGASATNAGASGGNTSFNSIVANGGAGGAAGAAALALGGAGGSGGAGSASLRIAGSRGGSNVDISGGTGEPGGDGGASAFGGEGPGGFTSSAGQSAATNSGGGGGGAGGNADVSGSAGGAGEYAEIIINAPLAASYSYAVGASGAGGAAGGFAGGNGGSGLIVVDELY